MNIYVFVCAYVHGYIYVNMLHNAELRLQAIGIARGKLVSAISVPNNFYPKRC